MRYSFRCRGSRLAERIGNPNFKWISIKIKPRAGHEREPIARGEALELTNAGLGKMGNLAYSDITFKFVSGKTRLRRLRPLRKSLYSPSLDIVTSSNLSEAYK